MGTDGCLLAVLSQISDGSRILDIGTGTGLIALMLAQRYPNSEIVGLDINPLAASLAKTNFDSSPWNDRMTAIGSDLNNYSASNFSSFDHMVCNPPFFKDSLLNQNSSSAQARHEVDLSLNELIEAAARLLSPKGKFTFILPYQRRQEIEEVISRHGLHIERRIEIKPFAHVQPNRVIYTIAKSDTDPSTDSIILYARQGEFTPTMLSLLRPFYIKL